MNRPLTPPNRPYTTEEYFARAEEHFFVSKNPRCVYSHGSMCLYSGTGCAVGFVMTERHAKAIDYRGPIWEIYTDVADIYHQYFTGEQLPMLKEMQQWHDSTESFGNREMFDAIRAKYTAKV